MIPTKQQMYDALAARCGNDLQNRFAAASVAVCGLGGLGSNVAVSLARAGIGKLHLIDFDKVDISNLNRQQYKVTQIGEYKTEALRSNLAETAPYCEIITDRVKMDDENISALLKNDTFVCEAFDNPESKAMLVNTVLGHFPEKYIVAASGMSGMHSSNTVLTRRITKHFYVCGDGVSDVESDGALFAPRVMLCAAHQANMLLRIIAGLYEI